MNHFADRLIAIGVLLAALFALGVFLDDRSGDRRADLEEQQREQRLASRAGCARGLLDRAEGIERDQDIANFASSAARKNRRVGGAAELEAARDYEGTAARARSRRQSATTRLLGADAARLNQRVRDLWTGRSRPTRAARAAAAAACAQANPLP